MGIPQRRLWLVAPRACRRSKRQSRGRDPYHLPRDALGYSVSISGDYAIVGASSDEVSSTGTGSAQIFRRTGTNSWESSGKIVAPDGVSQVGVAVAISGDYAVVNAYDSVSSTGSAYIRWIAPYRPVIRVSAGGGSRRRRRAPWRCVQGGLRVGLNCLPTLGDWSHSELLLRKLIFSWGHAP